MYSKSTNQNRQQIVSDLITGQLTSEPKWYPLK